MNYSVGLPLTEPPLRAPENVHIIVNLVSTTTMGTPRFFVLSYLGPHKKGEWIVSVFESAGWHNSRRSV